MLFILICVYLYLTSNIFNLLLCFHSWTVCVCVRACARVRVFVTKDTNLYNDRYDW